MAAKHRRLKVRLRLGLLAFVIGALALTGVAPAQQVRHQDRLIDEEKTKLAELTAQNSALQRRLARTQDPAYVEKLAREQLGLVRPGETAYVVVPGPEIAAPPKPAPPSKSWWERVGDWLNGIL